MVTNYRNDVWLMKGELKQEFLIYANQRRIAFNIEQFQHGQEEFADVESFVKHFPNVLEDWLNENKE